ncbi:MAG: hypothetical protein K9L56_15055 [Clostridiales bacterium]|nr:hypothetical protein [Clostridiales bacterium]
MHSLKDLQDYFGWSYVQARKRVIWLKDNFSSEVKGGQNRKYQVTDNGFAYLERLHQLEQSNGDLKAAQSQLLEEVKSTEEESVKGKAKSDKISPKYVDLLEKRVKELKEDKARLQEKVDSLENRLLPPEREQKSPFQRFWEWFGL